MFACSICQLYSADELYLVIINIYDNLAQKQIFCLVFHQSSKFKIPISTPVATYSTPLATSDSTPNDTMCVWTAITSVSGNIDNIF